MTPPSSAATLLPSVDADSQDMVQKLRAGAGLPEHIAIIMDGNGRWAKQRGLPRNAGHEAGEFALLEVVHGAIDRQAEVIVQNEMIQCQWVFL